MERFLMKKHNIPTPTEFSPFARGFRQRPRPNLQNLHQNYRFGGNGHYADSYASIGGFGGLPIGRAGFTGWGGFENIFSSSINEMEMGK